LRTLPPTGPSTSAPGLSVRRLRLLVRGAVQGVGFRPFVFRLARQLSLRGLVRNSGQGVCVEVEGEPGVLDEFLRLLTEQPPARSYLQCVEKSWLPSTGFEDFRIDSSDAEAAKTTSITPDLATCGDCVREILDARNRRFRYPFTNCTHCGPRFTIVERLPYDRENTSMNLFPMCPTCRQEYEDPLDRRFQAQANACPKCGPQVELWRPNGEVLAVREDALAGALTALRDNAIAAVKGLGGFHLMVRAGSEEAVRRLRLRKRREAKPLALMFPDLGQVRRHCWVSDLEARLLASPAAPIVLLRRRTDMVGQSTVAEAVAPGNLCLGVMLPYTPLHHLLLRELGEPVVATSGNVSDDVICIDNREARDRLGAIAEVLLVHNRPIVRPVDDSVLQVVSGREMPLRRSRGYAPLPISISLQGQEDTASAAAKSDLTCAGTTGQHGSTSALLAVGGQAKNTVACLVGSNVYLSQHVGDLDTAATRRAFRRTWKDLTELYEMKPEVIVTDRHPDYASTALARAAGRPLVAIQHHIAHVLSCMADNELGPPVLGVAWDGTGLGWDGTIWGGEFFLVAESTVERVAHLREFPLPGGEAAIREPRRAALGLLYELHGAQTWALREWAPLQAFAPAEIQVLQKMLEKHVCTPRTSSAGRLFDAFASILALRQRADFEGQAAMDLEFMAADIAPERTYPIPIREGIVDWGPMVEEIRNDQAMGVPLPEVSARFHESLAAAVVAVCRTRGVERVVLSGGCFQNRRLLERSVIRLQQAGLEPVWHQRVPPNDGGLSLGQIAGALRTLQGKECTCV
jgi:hydrogenase maturation protein HypF